MKGIVIIHTKIVDSSEEGENRCGRFVPTGETLVRFLFFSRLFESFVCVDILLLLTHSRTDHFRVVCVQQVLVGERIHWLLH